jgi:hypothetical protein
MNHRGLHHFGKLCSPTWAGASLPEISQQDIPAVKSIDPLFEIIRPERKMIVNLLAGIVNHAALMIDPPQTHEAFMPQNLAMNCETRVKQAQDFWGLLHVSNPSIHEHFRA